MVEEYCPILVWYGIVAAEQSWVSYYKCFQEVKGLDCMQVSPAPRLFYYEAMLLEQMQYVL